MRSSLRLVVTCLVCAVVGLIGWAASVSADVTHSSVGLFSLESHPFVVPSAIGMLGYEQEWAEGQGRRASPEAVAKREASRRKFAGLDRAGAVALAQKTFDVERPRWTAPGSLGEGRITKYLSSNSAVESSSTGKHLMVVSSVPLRSAVGSGKLAPTSLALQERDGVFVAANPVVPVSISRSVSKGISLPWGVSVAPGDAASPEAPVTVGDQVLYPRTATDTDFLVQPVPAGVEASWQLLSEDSPQENSLVFKLPAGSSLRMSKAMQGGAEVVKEGQTLTLVLPATATEADGSSLPVTYTVAGDRLVTHVDLKGSVAFPVMVDPLITGLYGAYGGASGTWPGWNFASNAGWTSEENSSLLFTEVGAGSWPSGDYGEWYIWAPGAGAEGGAEIQRVDLQGISHQDSETLMYGEIYDNKGTRPIYTFNGLAAGESRAAPYESYESFTGRAMAYCAEEAGGHDGNGPTENPLCDENVGGQAFLIEGWTNGSVAATNWIGFTGADVFYLDNTSPDSVFLHGIPAPKSGWMKYGPASTYISDHDQGVGIQASSIEIPPGHLNEGHPFWAESSSCSAGAGFHGCPQSHTSGNISFAELGTGPHTLGVYAYDAVGNVREEEVWATGEESHGTGTYPLLLIDHTPPKLAPLAGSLAEASGKVIGSGTYELKIKAEDGSSSEPQSGVHTITIYVDGRQVDQINTYCPSPTGLPTLECYALAGTWSMEAARYAVGTHTVKVVATDWMGNEASSSFQVTVNEVPGQQVGPGSVNPITGVYKLSSTDATMTAPGAGLTVGRVYDSREVTRGQGGPLGPEWTLSLPDAPADGVWQSLQVMPEGNIQATTASGTTVSFAYSPTEGYVPPAGYQTLKLAKAKTSPLEYEITDAAGNATIFTHAAGSDGESEPLLPTGTLEATGAGGLNKVTYAFTKTSEGVTEPTKVYAPSPAGTNCPSEIAKGCRVLEFKYSTVTTARGERES